MPKKIQKKKKNKTEPQVQETRPKDFLDLIAPAAVKFNTDHYTGIGSPCWICATQPARTAIICFT